MEKNRANINCQVDNTGMKQLDRSKGGKGETKRQHETGDKCGPFKHKVTNLPITSRFYVEQ